MEVLTFPQRIRDIALGTVIVFAFVSCARQEKPSVGDLVHGRFADSDSSSDSDSSEDEGGVGGGGGGGKKEGSSSDEEEEEEESSHSRHLPPVLAFGCINVFDSHGNLQLGKPHYAVRRVL